MFQELSQNIYIMQNPTRGVRDRGELMIIPAPKGPAGKDRSEKEILECRGNEIRCYGRVKESL